MNARDLFEADNLAGAIEAQIAAVKANPTDVDARYALSVYFCYAGELDRAFTHLNTIGQQQPELVMSSDVFKSHLIADLQRRKFYREDAKPLLPPNSPGYVEERQEAVLALRRGDAAAANAALDRAAETEKGHGGKLNGESFDALRDDDDLLGGVLEVYAGENYLWVPFESIRKLEIHEPTHLLDLLYMPADLEDVTGEEASVHIPALYEGSHLSSDGRVQAGQMTDWVEVDGVGHRGAGQKQLLIADGDGTREMGLREVRSLEFAAAASGENDGG